MVEIEHDHFGSPAGGAAGLDRPRGAVADAQKKRATTTAMRNSRSV
jgi:hypothetical protein